VQPPHDWKSEFAIWPMRSSSSSSSIAAGAEQWQSSVLQATQRMRMQEAQQ
jgi:hypothetical protein